MPLRVETYTSAGESGWTSAMLEDGAYTDIVADDQGNVYLLSAAKDASLLSLTKFDNAGDQVWSVDGAPAGLCGVDELVSHGDTGTREAWPLGHLRAQPHGGEGDSIGFVVLNWIQCSAG